MIVKGRLTQKLEVEKGTSKAGKDWQKQSIVIDNGDQFNPNICISFFGEDKIKMLKGFKEGQEIEVNINLSSREFNGKWYHSIDGWKISAGFDSEEVSKGNINKKQDEPDSLPF